MRGCGLGFLASSASELTPKTWRGGMQANLWIERKKKCQKSQQSQKFCVKKRKFPQSLGWWPHSSHFSAASADRTVVNNMSVMASVSELMWQFYIISFWNFNLQSVSQPTNVAKLHHLLLMIRIWWCDDSWIDHQMIRKAHRSISFTCLQKWCHR